MQSVVLKLGGVALRTAFRLGIASVLLLSTVACESQKSDRSSLAQPSPATTVSSEPSTPPTIQSQPLSATITTHGFGPIRVGMTVEEASIAARTQLIALDGNAPYLNESCSYVLLQNGHVGLEFMLNYDRIVRVDVRSRAFKDIDGRLVEVDLTPEVSQITTQSGVKIGDTEAQIQALYPGQIEVSGHRYVPNGHYLTFVPRDAEDSNYRLIFETDGNRVTYIRAGQLPQVEWVERCG